MATKTKKTSKKAVRSKRAKKLVLDEAESLPRISNDFEALGNDFEALGTGLSTIFGTGKSSKKTGHSVKVTRQTGELQSVRDPKERFGTVTVCAVEKSSGLKGLGLIEVGQAKKLELRDRLGMTRPIFGRIVNVAERTIAKVESGSETADKLKRPYNEVYRLWEALSELVEPSAIGPWFQKPNDAFDGLKPLEVIERGEIDRLWDMVFELQTGMPG